MQTSATPQLLKPSLHHPKSGSQSSLERKQALYRSILQDIVSMDSPQLVRDTEEGAAGGEDIEADEGEEEARTSGSPHMSHPFSMYEPHYQQMHPLIYYGDEFGYQQLSQIMAGKVDEHQHQVVHVATAAPGHVKQEEPVGATVLHFGHLSNGSNSHHSICRLELDFDQQNHHPPESGTTHNGLATGSPPTQEESLTNETTTTSTTTPTTNNPVPHHPSNRELHNEIERRRRSRIKYCCEVLKTLVPGLSDKTDKATVLEQTVKFMNHLVNCPNFRCNCEIQIEERKQY